MRIIRASHLTKCWKKHSRAKKFLAVWEEKIEMARFKSHKDILKIFPHADYVPNENFQHLTIFNVSGNHYRLVVDISFEMQEIYIKWFGSHGEYDKVNWNLYPNKGFVLC